MKDIFKGNGFLHVSYGNGDVYIGNFKNGIRCGEGKLWTNDNKIFKGYFENNKKNGYGIMTYKNGQILKGYWKNDVYIPKNTLNKLSVYYS